MKTWLRKIAPRGSRRRCFLSIARHSPFCFLQSILKSLYASHALTGKVFPVRCVIYPGMRFVISRHATASVKMSGYIKCAPFLGASGSSSILLGPHSKFTLLGDLELGQDVRISVSAGAEIVIGGRFSSTGSGITAETKVMVEKFLSIGRDVIIAWGCFITDSDWHDVADTIRFAPVTVGDNVWISHGVSILKGANIPEGCIVGAQSVVSKSGFPARALIAGNPAATRREGVSWTR